MRPRTELILAIALGSTVALAVVARRHLQQHPAAVAVVQLPPPAAPSAPIDPPEIRSTLPIRQRPQRPTAPVATPPLETNVLSPGVTPSATKKPSAPAGAAAPSIASSRRPKAFDPTAGNPPPKATPELAAPVARAALGLVGADADAERIWASAINDPAIPEHERSDLIEDLNEDGFPDPRHVTPDDIPLIVSRIDLIEQLAPRAMDEVNAAAFAEAYKDLNNMLARLARN